MAEQPGAQNEVVLEWLQSALEDVRVARRCLMQPPAARALFFHVQQAAQKALKAYLLALGQPELPRTHLLRDLAALVERQGGLRPQAEPVEFLDAYTVGVRYPDTYTPPLDVAPKAIEHAVHIVQHVLDQLGLRGPGEDQSQQKLMW